MPEAAVEAHQRSGGSSDDGVASLIAGLRAVIGPATGTASADETEETETERREQGMLHDGADLSARRCATACKGISTSRRCNFAAATC